MVNKNIDKYPFEIRKLSDEEGGGYMISFPGSNTINASGKFMLRLPKSLHASLIKSAKEENVSMNTLAVTLIAQGLAPKNPSLKHHTAKLVPVKVAEEVAELPEISHVKPNKSSDIYIRIGSKSSLIIPNNFKAETLARILGVLQNL